MADETIFTSKLAGTRVLIVGGSSGIGFGVARAVLEFGAAAIVISSSSSERISKSLDRLREAYPNKSKSVELLGHAVDLKDQSKLEENIEGLLGFATADKTKKLDHIVFTAGDPLALADNVSDYTMAFCQAAGTIRFFAPTILCARAPAYMNPGPKASITLTAGTVSQKPLPGWAIVGAYLSGLHGLTRGMALDLKPLRVNLVCPGAVMTELWDSWEPAKLDAFHKHLSEVLPLQDFGTPEQLAEPYLMAMRDSDCTGTILNSNGGYLLV